MRKLNRYISFELLFALVFIFAFFLPWVDMALMKTVGWKIPALYKKTTVVANLLAKNKTNVYQAYILYLIPIMSVLVVALWISLRMKIARILLAGTAALALTLSIYCYFSVPKAGSGIYLLSSPHN